VNIRGEHEGSTMQVDVEHGSGRRHTRRNRWLLGIAVALLIFASAFGLTALYVARHAGPLLRSSVISTLSARFHSPVQLDSLDISVAKGLEVEGKGLRVQYLAGPTRPDLEEAQGLAAPPMLSVREFRFHTSMADLMHLRANIKRVQVDGMVVRIPPRSAAPGPPRQRVRSKIKLHVEAIDCSNVEVVIEPGRPDKAALDFLVRQLRLTGVGSGEPMMYVADLVNPKPVGDIHAAGHLGPWMEDDPRLTPLDGEYTFTNVDLRSIRGLRGTLSSTGRFEGHLSRIAIDGTTNTPDFGLDVSGHTIPLETTFHAFVDGTTGDTTLDPVHATLQDSALMAKGTVKRILGKGHDIDLIVDMPDGRIQDVLQVSMKSMPPVMRGMVELHARLHIPPGKERVSHKLEMAGDVKIHNVVFTDAKLQGRVNAMSERAQGHAAALAADGTAATTDVASRMTVKFSLARTVMLVPSLRYEMPGATVAMDGVYLLDGRAFEFRGHARTQATASQMVRGWKSALLKPFDGMFKKDGAGLEIPVQITGTKDSYKLGFAMHGADETPQQIEANLRAVRAMELDEPRNSGPKK
jgi:hypothetical protein